MTTDRNDLDCCPFCGGNKLQINTPEDNKHLHGDASIFCITCTGSIRTKLSLDLPAKWNKRTVKLEQRKVWNLFEVVESAATYAQRNGFVANVMITGTLEHAAIECGKRIGQKFRGQIELLLAPEVEDKEIF